MSQRRKVMPLVLLMMRSGIDRVEGVEHGLAHQVGVQRRNAVDLVRTDEGEVPHSHPAPGVFVDQRNGGEQSASRRIRAVARCRDAPR